MGAYSRKYSARAREASRIQKRQLFSSFNIDSPSSQMSLRKYAKNLTLRNGRNIRSFRKINGRTFNLKKKLVLKKNKTILPRVGDCSFVQCEFSELIWDLLIRFELICFALYRILGFRVRQFSRIS